MMGLQRRGPSIVAVKSNTAVPVKETVFIATAMPSCRNGRAGVWKHLFVCIEIRTWKSRPMLQGVSKLHWIRLYTFEQHLWGTITIPKKEFINYSRCYPNCQVNWKTSVKCVTDLRWWMVRKKHPSMLFNNLLKRSTMSNSESLVKMLWFLSSALIHRQLTSIVMVPVVR